MGEDILEIILVSYNRLDFTKKTVESLFRTTKSQFRLILIDNCSTEQGFAEYLDQVENTFSNVIVLRNTVNKGWGAAVNTALDCCHNEWVLISNNDVEYSDDWLSKAKKLYEIYGDKIGILGLWKHIAHGTKQHLGDLVVKDDMPAVAWLLKKSVIVEIGPLKENGPCATKGGNGEDTDYCQRAMALGYWVCGPNVDLAQHATGY